MSIIPRNTSTIQVQEDDNKKFKTLPEEAQLLKEWRTSNPRGRNFAINATKTSARVGAYFVDQLLATGATHEEAMVMSRMVGRAYAQGASVALEKSTSNDDDLAIDLMQPRVKAIGNGKGKGK